MIVLDTNAISELEGRLHSERLLAWLDSFQIETLFLTTIAVAEIRFGLAMLPEGKRRTRLAFTFDRIEAQFDGRILGYSLGAAHGYGALCAEQIQQGHIMETKDAMIAATCLTRGASLATRNTKDFEGLDLKLINPFEDS
jgi:predicted nucleic acid-binding protein